MNKTKFLLRDDRIRRNLKEFIDSLPTDTNYPLEITINDPDRTLPQNSLFHALCGDLEKQGVMFFARTWPLVAWKVILVSGHAVATGKPGEIIKGIEGELVPIRESTAKMGIRRMNSLIEYSQAFAVGNGVKLREVRYTGDYFGRAS